MSISAYLYCNPQQHRIYFNLSAIITWATAVLNINNATKYKKTKNYVIDRQPTDDDPTSYITMKYEPFVKDHQGRFGLKE